MSYLSNCTVISCGWPNIMLNIGKLVASFNLHMQQHELNVKKQSKQERYF